MSNLTSPARPEGLSSAEAEARLAAEGYNELPRQGRRSSFAIILDVLREPMLALLIGGGLIYLLLGEPRDALILLAFACLSIAITAIQESRSESVLDALRSLTSPRALVIRDGQTRRIAGREVVRGDLMMLAEGDRVPADAILIDAQDLLTDESLLTGESVPVRKQAAAGPPDKANRPGGDDLPNVYSGALVVRGTGLAEVTATGVQSEIGKIGTSLESLETEPRHLQTETRRMVLIFALLGGAISVIAVLLYGFLRGGWLEALLAGIAIGMSMLPEEFPVVLTVFMVMGAWRISHARVLTRRAVAIETLGSATVLCTDKTGTLTENRMTVAELRPWTDGVFEPATNGDGAPGATRDLAETGILASAREPFDPMEKAFHDFGRRELGEGIGQQMARWQLVQVYGLRPDLLAVTQIWRRNSGDGELFVAAKGAPEAIAGLCRLGEADRQAIDAAIDEMAKRGLRVLGIARATHNHAELPASQRDFDFTFLGLVGLADPLRPGVPNAVAQCRAAGIRVVMITGDYPATAAAIAGAAGLGVKDILTGPALDGLDRDELAQRVRTVDIFARIQPEQKLRIVNALKANGEIVAMTGDGVNDAPSLKSAHIGIAMGGRGTDVAREASSIVLLDDDFGSIVTAMRMGRRIYDNLRKAMAFIFAVHVPIAGLALTPLIFGLPIVFLPIHIAFLEMVIDPVCSLAFEAEKEEDDIMRRPPRSPKSPLFSAALIFWSLLQGALAFLVVVSVYFYAVARSMPEIETRAITFVTLIVAIVGLILVNRSFGSSLIGALFGASRTLAYVLVAVATGLGTILLWLPARDLFRFGPLHADDLAIATGVGLMLMAVLEGLKRIWRNRLQV